MSAFTTDRSRLTRLSTTYSLSTHRARARDVIRWSTTARRLPCEECFALQHEDGGVGAPRSRARLRRSVRGGPDIFVCGEHADLWKVRDDEDRKGRRA